MNFSYWEDSEFIKQIDYLIVGAGITGLSTALSLRELQPNARIVIVERGFIPMGASTRNAGFACFGSLTELAADIETMGSKAAWHLVEKRWKGLGLLKKRLGKKAMDYQEFGGHEIFLKGEAMAFEKATSILNEANYQLKRITGLNKVFTEAKDKDFGMKGIQQILFNKAEGQLNPAKMILALIQLCKEKEIIIFWGAEVLGWSFLGNGVEVQIKQAPSLFTQKILIAVNGFVSRLNLKLDTVPARNWVLVTAPIEGLSIKGTFHYDEGYFYFRNIGNRVLLGGGRKLFFLKETTDQFGCNKMIQNQLIAMLNETILPNTKIKIAYQWSGIMGVGTEKNPILRKVSDGVYLAVRLGGMGIALGSELGADAAALLVRD